MRLKSAVPMFVVFACAGLLTTDAPALTIDEAVELSQRTGRPILAVAGAKG